MSAQMRFATVFAKDGNWYKVENLRITSELVSWDRALAGLAGCSLATVRTIEAGPPSLAMAERIVAALGRIESEVEGS